MKFERWLDKVLKKPLPSETVAVNFNLYELEERNGESCWSVELIGAEEFDEEDSDWACDEIFASERFDWKEAAEWDEVLSKVTEQIRAYLENGKYAERLKAYQAVAVGFVDGDLNIVYQK